MSAAAPSDTYAIDRRTMVDCQLRTFDVTDHAVLAAFDTVPREKFVAPASRNVAYADMPLPTGTAPQRQDARPMVLARMIQALGIAPGDKVLDIAGGAGYGAALLAELGANVTALETQATASAGPGVRAVSGALDLGWPGSAPYDSILLHGAVARAPTALVAQLRDGGRLICGDCSGEVCQVVSLTRFGTGVRKKILFDAALSPLAEFAATPEFAF